MSQETRYSSEHQTHNDEVCVSCKEVITDHIYFVQRRSVRPLKETLSTGKVQFNPADLLDSSHAGIILGKESDPYCTTCYQNIPSAQELIDANKG